MKIFFSLSMMFSLSLMTASIVHAGTGAEPSSNPEAYCDANPFKRGCPVFRASDGKPMEFNTKAAATAYLASHPLKNATGKTWIWKKSPSNHWIQRWE